MNITIYTYEVLSKTIYGPV